MIFMCLNVIDNLQLVDRYTMSLYYFLADIIGKMITCIIISDYNEKEMTQLKKMDLQSVQFVSYMLQNIKKYQYSNFISFLTPSFNPTSFSSFTNLSYMIL